MSFSKPSEHTGIINEVTKNSIVIHLIEKTNCDSCQTNHSCALSQRQDQIIEITTNDQAYKPGDKITIINEPNLGFKAVFIGYILPFLLIIITLLIATNLTQSETQAGLLSISILIPYYFCLYLFRKKLKKTFEFRIKNNLTNE